MLEKLNEAKNSTFARLENPILWIMCSHGQKQKQKGVASYYKQNQAEQINNETRSETRIRAA